MKLRFISAPRSWSHKINTVVLITLTFWHIQCLHLLYAGVAWVSSGTQVQPQILLDPDYLPDYPSVSYDYGNTKNKINNIIIATKKVLDLSS